MTLRFEDPYWSADDWTTQRQDILRKELQSELHPDHQLFNQSWQIIASRVDNDDVILRLDCGKIAVVHLTWTSAPESGGFPNTRLFDNATKFWEKEMHKEILNYKS
ncbi:hypothetical protein GGR28_003795 [Lewinella aquimaris]|uniref:Uncharacterized protein n=1 Tax=Neolewinella aquimaris TaxID=1835722 RepID=A0A840ECE1_9BACT|nr:hypothetical protein [Neolewinella aquimaris]MBB4081147.1 hypothetical protein [Neolewinella aquimaris]